MLDALGMVTRGKEVSDENTTSSHSSLATGQCPFMKGLLVLLIVHMARLGGCPAEAHVELVPGCLESCSDQVGCSITQNHCVTEQTASMNVAAALQALKVERTNDSRFQYVNFDWRPPSDGSYKDLKGFQVKIHIINGNRHAPGISGSHCYTLSLDTNWTTHYNHPQSVDFYFRCLRMRREANLELHVTILSLPINPDVPKMAKRRIDIFPISEMPQQWNPQFQRWADANSVLHVRIRNPLKSAALYEFYLYSLRQRQPVFSSILPASYDAKHSNNFTVKDENGYPHYVIPNLSKTDNYSIVLNPMYLNKSRILPSYIRTKFFSPNFTTNDSKDKADMAVVQTPSESKGQLDGALIAIVLVTALLLLMALFFLAVCWRLYRRSHIMALCLTCRDFSPGTGSGGSIADSKILPVYCHENESFVRAVESHVSLLKRYVDVISVQDRISRSLGGRRLCCMAPLSWVYREVKSRDAIIYLSPRLAKLARLRDVNDLEAVTDLDRYCHRALMSLGSKRGSCRHCVSSHLIIFDCFQSAERDCLRALENLPNGLSLFQSQGENRLDPLTLSSSVSGSPKLVNLELLLFQLCQLKDFPHELPVGHRDWHDTPEARVTEAYLSALSAEYVEDCSTLRVDIPEETPSPGTDRLEETEGDGMEDRGIRFDTNCVQYSVNGDPTLSDSHSRDLESACLNESFVEQNDDVPSKEDSHQITPCNSHQYHDTNSERSSCSLAYRELRPNKQCNSNVSRAFAELASLDSGYISKPFFNPRLEDISYQKRYPSSSGLTNGIDQYSSQPIPTSNCADFPYDSDSDNNECDGKINAMESDKLLCRVKGEPPFALKGKNGDRISFPENQLQIIPPRFLPDLTVGNSSISDLISGINDKTAWQ